MEFFNSGVYSEGVCTSDTAHRYQRRTPARIFYGAQIRQALLLYSRREDSILILMSPIRRGVYEEGEPTDQLRGSRF